MDTMELKFMEKPEIEGFAKILVQQVRDRAIRSCDRRLQEGAKSVIAARWKKIIRDPNSASVVEAIIPDVVDCAFAQVPWAIDQKMLPLIFRGSSGRNVNLLLEGSLPAAVDPADIPLRGMGMPCPSRPTKMAESMFEWCWEPNKRRYSQ